ncbi:chemotaxis protein CheW [Thermaerobacter subterraneus]|uniref:Chemotaxis protein CheW n=1 Tax=Thermaerobacter subterraneus DSM 13965 TaxID=867903 RepID=K6PQ52_9FIRM|nr:chemotaxis protein CheW [Thermaerobacter subterraneus]EKP95047.1 chemotaxis signal transduction protein [Thermaerobacter subterraneus DSM 13965]
MAADGPRRPEATAQEPRVLVLFRLAGEDYGIDVGCVREIITWQQPTRVPRTPPFVEGIINLRGHIIPVLDLRRRLGLPEGSRERSTRVVVVELDTTVVGLVVDAVSEVVRLPAGTIEPPAEVLAVDASFIEGIARHGDRLILVLQPGQVLAPAEWQAVQAVQVAEAAPAAAAAGGADSLDEAGAGDTAEGPVRPVPEAAAGPAEPRRDGPAPAGEEVAAGSGLETPAGAVPAPAPRPGRLPVAGAGAPAPGPRPVHAEQPGDAAEPPGTAGGMVR